MDADEKTLALKKAYADIILNTAKEAAARIMVSERRAQKLEYELKVAKEEGVRLLLRLKHMMDSKISEAELTSTSQQKKIEELELQLQEGEDIVHGLREELREMKYKLERETNDKEPQLNDRDNSSQGQISGMNHVVEFQTPQSQAGSIVACAMNHTPGCCCSSIYMGKSYKGSPELPSIILRSKGREKYRNGFTQRIRACDRNLMGRQSSLPGAKNEKGDEKRVKEDVGNVFRKARSHGGERKRNVDKKVVKADNVFPNWSIIQKKKRAMRNRKHGTPSTANVPRQSARDVASSDENHSQISPRLLSEKSERPLQSICSVKSENEAKLVESCTNQNAKLQNMVCRESSEVPISDTSLVTTSQPSIKLELEASETCTDLTGRTTTDRKFMYTFQRKRKRQSMIRSDETESYRNNVSEENASVGKSASNENVSLEKTTPHENASLEKSAVDDNTSLGNNTSMRKNVEGDNGSDDEIATESCRDSQQLIQVARQLISLSEQKWRQ